MSQYTVLISIAATAALVHHTWHLHLARRRAPEGTQPPDQAGTAAHPLWLWWCLAFLCPSVIILYYVMVASSLKSYVNFFSIWLHAVVPVYIIAGGALVMALCWQIEQALLDIGPDEGGSDRPTSISGHL